MAEKKSRHIKTDWFTVWLGLQIILVVALVIYSLFAPKVTQKVNFLNTDEVVGNNVTLTENAAVFSTLEGIDANNMQEIPIYIEGLAKGGYYVNVTYSITGNTNDNQKISMMDIVFSREASQIKLYVNANQATGKLWIPLLTAPEDVKMTIKYKGDGQITIHEITVEESYKYRVARILAVVLFLLFVDTIIYFFFTGRPVKKEWKSVWVILGICFLASLPALGMNLYNGHDLNFHLLRISALTEEITNGQFPVRMATTVNYGYGYPNPIYYCDFFLFIPAVLHWFMVPLRICYQVYILMINLLTAFITYFTMKRLVQNEKIRLLGTALYVLSVYRLANIYIRGAVGEYTAMTFLPLVIIGVIGIYSTEKPTKKEWLPLSLGMAGIIMSHVLTVEMVVINLGLLCLVLLPRTIRKYRILSLIKAAVTTALLTMWYWLPFLDYMMHQKTFVMEEDLWYLQKSSLHLLTIFQMFAPGNDNNCFTTIGLSLCLGILVVFFALYKQRDWKRINKTSVNTLRILSLFFILDLLFVWQYFPWTMIQKVAGVEGLGYQIGSLHIVWRYLSIATALLVFAITIAVSHLEIEKYNITYLLFGFALVILIGSGFFYSKYVESSQTQQASVMEVYQKTDNLYYIPGTDENIFAHSYCNVMEGDAIIREYRKEKGRGYLDVENESDSVSYVEVPIFAYRYYEALDEEGRELSYDLSPQNLVLVEVPANYIGIVTIKFVEPIQWRIAEIMSLLTMVVLFVQIFLSRKKHA